MKKISSSEFSILLAWHEFEECYISDSMSPRLQTLMEIAYFRGAEAALKLSGESDDKIEINERLESLKNGSFD
jgi:hypothetical protein